ncbi:MAG: TPR end-of-group domain-containing protein [Planctomycetota bacterium]|jgi:predicted esterase
MLRILACLTVLAALAFAEEPTPPTLPPSLRDRADEALMAKKYAESLKLYRQWLEADPRDSNGWYNFACALALSGDKPAALDALGNSVTAGWSDKDHPRKDPDLASVRDDPRFEAALKRIKPHGGRAPTTFVRHFAKTTTLGSYIVMLPPDYATSGEKTYPVCVILHGSGSTELGHGRVADKFGRDGVIYVAPRALHPHVGAIIGRKQPGFTVWPPEKVETPNPMDLHAAWVLTCVDDVAKRYRVRPGRFWVWGHSQGAAGAHAVACAAPERVAGYLAYAGYFEDRLQPETLALFKKHGVQPVLVHGRKDTVVLPKETETAEAKLKEAGVAVTVHWTDGTHRIDETVEKHSLAWLAAGPRKP